MKNSRCKQYEKIKHIAKIHGNKKLEQWASMWKYTSNAKAYRYKIWCAKYL